MRRRAGAGVRKSLAVSTVVILGGILLGVCAGRLPSQAQAADGPFAIPPPKLDESVPSRTPTTEIAVLAGGCFWGVQGVFQHVKGVISAVSGYSGGSVQTAHYEIVSTGTTGHAESVRVTFNPHKISYGTVLQIFFSVVTVPTELNRQGPDVGTQYRSEIFTTSATQSRIAKSYIQQLNATGIFSSSIVTKVALLRAFYRAEGYHQNFLARHPTNPYIMINDLPKIANLKHLFPALYRQDAVLVPRVD